MGMTKTLKRVAALAAAGLISQAAWAAPTLWVSDADGTLGRLDLGSGAVSIVGEMSLAMTDIAFNAEGELWGVNAGGLYRIDPLSAGIQFVAGLDTTVNSLVFDADGTLYAANTRLWTVNTASGAVTPRGGATGGFDSSGDLAFVDGRLYLSSMRPVADTLFRLDATSGEATSVGPGLGVERVFGLATDDNVHLYGLTDHSVVSINPTTGTSTWLLDYSAASGLGAAWGTAFVNEAVAAIPVASVPVAEPPTAVLMGAAGLFWALRRLRHGSRRAPPGAGGAQVPPT